VHGFDSTFAAPKSASLLRALTDDIAENAMHAELGVEWSSADPVTGMAEIAGVDSGCLKAWSQRSTRLRQWVHNNLVVGEPTADQLAAAQKATRPAKPESKSWAELKEDWRADARGLELDRTARGAGPRPVGAHGRQYRQAGVHAPISLSWWERSCRSKRPGIRAR